MPQIGFILEDNRKVLFDDCLAGLADSGVPAPLLASIIEAQRENPHRGRMISVTSLIGCLRAVYLERTEDYFASLIQNWYPHRGTVMHKALEADLAEWDVEKTFSREFGGTAVTGRIDAYDRSSRTLYDWKTTSGSKLGWIRSNGLPAEHVLQLNAYRLLMGEDFPVARMRLVYLGMNEIGITGLGDPPWPTGVVGLPEVEFLDDAEVEERFARNAKTLSDAFDNGSPPPIADEETRRWKCHRFCPVNEFCAAIGDNPTLLGPVWAGLPKGDAAVTSWPVTRTDGDSNAGGSGTERPAWAGLAIPESIAR